MQFLCDPLTLLRIAFTPILCRSGRAVDRTNTLELGNIAPRGNIAAFFNFAGHYFDPCQWFE
jgi:hypothetical protein